MMKIFLRPKVAFDSPTKITYIFDCDIIQATLSDGLSDTFDFTEVPDGELKLKDEEGKNIIETAL